MKTFLKIIKRMKNIPEICSGQNGRVKRRPSARSAPKRRYARSLRCISLALIGVLLCALPAGCALSDGSGKQEKTEQGQRTEGAKTETGAAGGTAPESDSAAGAGGTGPANSAADGTGAAKSEDAEQDAELLQPREKPLTEQQKTENRIREYLCTLSPEDKVSGLFIITPEALTGYGQVTEAGEATREALKNYPVAGLVCFSGNIISREQVKEMLALMREWGSARIDTDRTPAQASGTDGADTEATAAEALQKSGTVLSPFLAVDEEGGSVARIGNSPIDVPYVGSMGSVGATGDPEAAYEAGSTIGAYLQELGFNLDFAPDADVLADPGNVTIGDRSFGSEAELCGQMVHRYVDGLHEYGIASCIKHFPGLGDTESDTHTGSAISSRTIEGYRSTEFFSFGGGIDAGTEMVMIAHLSNAELSGSDLPASLNKTIITDLLRGELGFEGIVITDSLQMGAVTERFGSAEAAVAAIDAGADILLMPSDFFTARQGILDALSDGRISEERIDESLLRILRARAALAE